MKLRCLFSLCLCGSMLTPLFTAHADQPEEDLLKQAGRDLTPLVRLLNAPTVPWQPAAGEDGQVLFARYVAGVIRALEAHPSLAQEVSQPQAAWARDLRHLLVWGYVVRAFHQALPSQLRELVQLRTVAAGEQPEVAPADWDAFTAHLRRLCTQWGLSYRLHDRERVVEISLPQRNQPAGGQVMALAVADTPDAVETDWQVPPFAGQEVDRKVVARGAVVKGGLIAALFALKALQDSQVQLVARPILLVTGRGEAARRLGRPACSPSLLGRGPKFFVGGHFPVGVGESGLAQLEITAPVDGRSKDPVEGTPGFRIVEIRHLSSTSRDGGEIIAILDPRETPLRRAIPTARRVLAQWAPHHQGWHASVEEADGGKYLQIKMKPGESGFPLLVTLLGKELGVFPDARGRLIRFLADKITSAPDGQHLGISVQHARFPSTRLLLERYAQDETGGASARVRLSWPPGQQLSRLLEQLGRQATEYGRSEGGTLLLQGAGVDPHLLPDEDATVQTLLQAYEEATRKEPQRHTQPLPTATKGLGLAPTFGPLAPGAPHQPEEVNEALENEALVQAARIYAVAFLRLAELNGRTKRVR